MRKVFSLILALLILSGCMGTMYYDVAADEITTPEGVGEAIPQEGTMLSLDLTYEFDVYTRFEPGEDYRAYRYRVLIDGEIYSQGIVSRYSYGKKTTIPIMANDTHSPVTVVVEGSKALEYSDFPTSWDTWHELYRGTQEYLPATASPRYAGLAGAKMGMTIDGKTYTFDISDSASGEAFKRLLAEWSVPLPVIIDDTIWPYYLEGAENEERRFLEQVLARVPANCPTEGVTLKEGGIYSDNQFGGLYICLKSGKDPRYTTLLGFVTDADLNALKALYPGKKNQVESSMTLFLK
jgi:hypothetical protein